MVVKTDLIGNRTDMALSLNKPKLDNLAGDIWKSAERLRGKFKAYEYQSVILPIIVIRRLESGRAAIWSETVPNTRRQNCPTRNWLPDKPRERYAAPWPQESPRDCLSPGAASAAMRAWDTEKSHGGHKFQK